MTKAEFTNLQQGDRIEQRGEVFIVHNSLNVGTGRIMVVRTEVIRGCDCIGWSVVKKYEPVKLAMPAGTYEVQVVRRL